MSADKDFTRPRSGPGTRKAVGISPASIDRFRRNPMTRSFRPAAIRCNSTRWARRTASGDHSVSRNFSRFGHKGAEYDAWLIRIMDGDQFGSAVVEVNPNSKIPAMVDRNRAGADPDLRIRRDPALSCREIRRLPAHCSAYNAPNASFLAVLAGAAHRTSAAAWGHFIASAPEKIE